MKTTPFVVLTAPRTGSTWLMDTLDSHPQIAAYDELFLGADGLQPRPVDIPDFARYAAGTRPSRLRRATYLRLVFRSRPGVSAVGFKLIYGQARANPGLLSLLSLRRVRAVHLVRANLLDAVISYEVARASGVFHRVPGDSVSETRVSLDADDIRERLGYMEWEVSRGRGWLERYRLPRLDVAYEELVGRHEETLLAILRFLGVEPVPELLHSSFVPVRVGSKLGLVTNADEIRAALAGTRFAWMTAASESER